MPGVEHDLTPLPDLLHGRPRAGPVRDRRPVYVDLLPPCNNACPAGENIQGWLGHARVGKHEEAWRLLVADNPFAAIHGRVCYHPCESNCNRVNLDSAVSIHAVERFLGDAARENNWQFAPPPEPSGRKVLDRRRRPQRSVGRLPPGPARTCRRDPRRRRRTRRHDALRHPELPAPPRGARRRDPAHRRARRADHLRAPGRRPRRRTPRRASSTRRSSRSAPTWPSGSTSRSTTRRRWSTRWRSCAASPRGASGDRAPRGGVRRRQHRDGRRPGGAPTRRRRHRHHLPPHPRADARARGGGRGGRARRRADPLAAHHRRLRPARDAGRGHGTRRQRQASPDRAVRDAGRRHRDHGAGPGDRVGVHAQPARGGVRRRRVRAGVARR